MVKLPKVRYVKFMRAKGRVYAYFNTGKKVAGKTVFVPMPPYSSVGFWDSHAAMMGARAKRNQVIFTIEALAEAYQKSDEYRNLAKGSQKIYRLTINRIVAELGDFPVEAVERKHIRAVLDDIPGASSRNLFMAVTGVLYKWARGRDLTERKPTEGIAKFKTGEHDPWPHELLTAALSCDDPIVRLSTCLLYNSGQRLGDAIKLRWSNIRNGKIVMTQQKTGKPMLIPLSADLDTELTRTSKRGLTIIARENGRPVGAEAVRIAIKAFAANLGFDVVPHGLRKNAVNSLLLAGCTVPEVQAITGQSAEMVAHYAKQIDQSRMGEAAIIKFNARGANK